MLRFNLVFDMSCFVSDEITQILIIKDLYNLVQTMKRNIAMSCDLIFCIFISGKYTV